MQAREKQEKRLLLGEDEVSKIKEVRMGQGVWMVKAVAPFYPSSRRITYYRDHIQVVPKEDLSWIFDRCLELLEEDYWKDSAVGEVELFREKREDGSMGVVRVYYFDINPGKPKGQDVKTKVAYIWLSGGDK